jgi:predicted Zn-dependent peptidase
MVNSFIAKKDLDSEMTVVRNEFELGENSPSNALIERMFSTAYLWHNYGKSTIGAKSDLENVPIDRLQAFYKRYYQPDNAVLLVAGKMDETKVLELVSQYFSPIPKPTRVLPRIYTEDPVQDGERTVVVRRVGDTQLVASAYHVPAGSHPEIAAVNILLQIMSDTPSGRLHKAIVETKKASSVFGFPYFFAEPNLFVVGAEVRQDTPIDPAREALLEVVENVGKSPNHQGRSRTSSNSAPQANRAEPQLLGTGGTGAERMDRGGRLAHALRQSRSPSQGHARRRTACSHHLPQAFESDARPVCADTQAGSRGNPLDSRRPGDGQGL